MRTVDDLTIGQKNVIWSLLWLLAALAVASVSGLLFAATYAASVWLGWSGVYRITRGLGYPLVGRLLLLAGMLMPFASLILLLLLNHQATAHLKQAGFSVGWMGARKT